MVYGQHLTPIVASSQGSSRQYKGFGGLCMANSDLRNSESPALFKSWKLLGGPSVAFFPRYRSWLVTSNLYSDTCQWSCVISGAVIGLLWQRCFRYTIVCFTLIVKASYLALMLTYFTKPRHGLHQGRLYIAYFTNPLHNLQETRSTSHDIFCKLCKVYGGKISV